MEEILDEEVTAKPPVSPRASHKITIKDGGKKYVYWYVKGKDASRGFEKSRDVELVKLAHQKSLLLRPGGFESFSIDPHLDYHIMHVGPNEFELEALRN